MEPSQEPTSHHLSSYHRYRSWVATKHPSIRLLSKALVTVLGVLVVLIGIVLIPLPGPGWLIVFFGLSIIGLEFPPIQRFTSWVGSRAKSLWSSTRARFAPHRHDSERPLAPPA